MKASEILNIVLPTLMTAVIIPLLVAVGKAVSNYLKTRTKNETLQKYFDRANDAIVTAVAEVMQTFVETMKREGTWNREAAAKALEMAKDKAIEIMGVAAWKALPEIVGDVEAWLISKIEAATLQTKQGVQVMRTLNSC